MSPLDQWRELAREENARMREVCFEPLARPCGNSGNTGKPSEAVAQRRAETWALYQRGMSVKAIAAAVGRPVGTIKYDLSVWRRNT